MDIKIISRCYDNNSYIMNIVYTKNNDQTGKQYIMIRRKIRGCWVTVSDTGQN